MTTTDAPAVLKTLEDIARLPKGVRPTADQRAQMIRLMSAAYREGASIRKLEEDTGRSFGYIHKLLTEGGVVLRERGGAMRKKAKS